MLAVMDLPTLDALRDEQRSLRAELARLRGRLHRQLVLELATDAVDRADGDGRGPGLPRLAVSFWTAGSFAPPDPLFRRGFRLLGRPCLPEMALIAARRAIVGSHARSLPAGGRSADRRRASAPRTFGRARSVGLAGHGAAGRPAGVRGPRRVGLALALEPEADGPARRRLAFRPDGPTGIRSGCASCGSVKRGALAHGFLRTLAAAHLPYLDGPRWPRPACGSARRTVHGGSTHRFAIDRSTRKPVVGRRPG